MHIQCDESPLFTNVDSMDHAKISGLNTGWVFPERVDSFSLSE